MASTPPLATARRRTAAYLVDLVALGAPLLAAVVAVSDDPRERLVGGGLVGLVAANLYHVVLEGATGRTPGKRAVGVEVVRTDGSPCDVRAATVRTLARFVDFLPVAYLVAYLSMALTDRRQRLGDLLGGTVVVVRGDGL